MMSSVSTKSNPDNEFVKSIRVSREIELEIATASIMREYRATKHYCLETNPDYCCYCFGIGEDMR